MPRRHRRPPPSLGRVTALIVTGLAVLVWWGLAAFVPGPRPTDPEPPNIGLPPSATPEVSAPASQPAGSPSTPGIGAGRRTPTLPPKLDPAAPSRNDQPGGAQQAAHRPAVPQPAVPPPPQPAVTQPPQPAVPQPAARQPAAPEPAPSPTAPEPVPSPAAPAPNAPPSAAPPSGDGGGRPKPTSKRRGPKVDQRYASCDEVVAAGLGPYKERRDVEYEWYLDVDGDGWACEYPSSWPGRR